MLLKAKSPMQDTKELNSYTVPQSWIWARCVKHLKIRLSLKSKLRFLWGKKKSAAQNILKSSPSDFLKMLT